MIYYIIKHKTNGKYIPAAVRKRGRTCLELSNDDIPRLFKRISSAKQALTWWLKGKYYLDYPDDTLNIIKVANRHKDDMCIVKVKLIEDNS